MAFGWMPHGLIHFGFMFIGMKELARGAGDWGGCDCGCSGRRDAGLAAVAARRPRITETARVNPARLHRPCEGRDPGNRIGKKKLSYNFSLCEKRYQIR